MTDEADTEASDADLVDQAGRMLAAGDLDQAEAMLLDIVARAPATYELARDGVDNKEIKFWDQNEFVYYVQWHQAHGTAHAVEWIGSAYPRAYYYLGFINVKLKRHERAITFLKAGAALEPTNPRFACEHAQALVGMGRLVDAVALYVELAGTELGPHTSPRDIAMANRGSGFVFIELGELEHAETAYRRSLEFEPGNALAAGQLAYIASLRDGAAAVPGGTVATTPKKLTQCTTCGATNRPGTLHGSSFVCEACESPKPKPWWAFWKR